MLYIHSVSASWSDNWIWSEIICSKYRDLFYWQSVYTGKDKFASNIVVWYFNEDDSSEDVSLAVLNCEIHTQTETWCIYL